MATGIYELYTPDRCLTPGSDYSLYTGRYKQLKLLLTIFSASVRGQAIPAAAAAAAAAGGMGPT